MMSGRWSMGFRLQRLLLTVSRSCWDRLKKKLFINQVSLAKSWEIRFQSLAFGCGITVSILAWLQSWREATKKVWKIGVEEKVFFVDNVLFMLFDMCTSESNITCMAMHRRINQSLNLLTHQNGWHFCGETQRLCARRFPDSFCPKIDLNGAHKGKSGAMTWDVRHVVKRTRIFCVQKRNRINEWKENMAKTEMCKFHSLSLCFGVMCSVGCSVKSKKRYFYGRIQRFDSSLMGRNACYVQCYSIFNHVRCIIHII